MPGPHRLCTANPRNQRFIKISDARTKLASDLIFFLRNPLPYKYEACGDLGTHLISTSN